MNSIIVAVCTTVLAVGLGTPAAYALARFEFRGKTDLWFWFITNRFVRPVVLAFPVFLIARELGLRDTHLALILMYLTFTLPIVIWICTDQFRVDPARTGRGGAAGRRLAMAHLPVDLPAAGDAGGGGVVDPVLHLLVERTAVRLHPCPQDTPRPRPPWRSPSWKATTCPMARSWRHRR